MLVLKKVKSCDMIAFPIENERHEDSTGFGEVSINERHKHER